MTSNTRTLEEPHAQVCMFACVSVRDPAFVLGSVGCRWLPCRLPLKSAAASAATQRPVMLAVSFYVIMAFQQCVLPGAVFWVAMFSAESEFWQLCFSRVCRATLEQNRCFVQVWAVANPPTQLSGLFSGRPVGGPLFAGCNGAATSCNANKPLLAFKGCPAVRGGV